MKLKIFNGSANRDLAKKISRFLKIETSKSVIMSFSDSEFSGCPDGNIRESDVYIINSTYPSADNFFQPAS